MDRRVFMKSGALALVTMGLSPSFLRRTAFGAELLQRRGDATARRAARRSSVSSSAVRPTRSTSSCRTARRRTTGCVPTSRSRGRRSRAGPAGAIDLDGFFGLHPALAPMKPLWDQGILAPVHAVGSPSSTRSHFDAQDYMETGTPDQKGTRDGWLNRYLAVKGTCEAGCAHDATPSPFRAVAMTQQTPRMLEGPAPTIAMNSLDEFSVRATGPAAERLEALYRTGSADVVHAAGGEMFEAVKILSAANPQQYLPQNGAEYPSSQFGQRLQQIAQLIKADVGLEVAFADVGGWDTHVNQGASTGQLAAAARRFRAVDRRARHRPRRPDGRRDDHDDVGVRPHGATERQRRHGSRSRRRAVRDRRRREGQEGARQVAGPRAGAALRGPRPRAHDRLPLGVLRSGSEAPRRDAKLDVLFPGFAGGSRAGSGML